MSSQCLNRRATISSQISRQDSPAGRDCSNNASWAATVGSMNYQHNCSTELGAITDRLQRIVCHGLSPCFRSTSFRQSPPRQGRVGGATGPSEELTSVFRQRAVPIRFFVVAFPSFLPFSLLVLLSTKTNSGASLSLRTTSCAGQLAFL